MCGMLDIYTYGDEALTDPCTDVTEFGSALRVLVDAMFDTMKEADGVGLAGPQVGVNQRLFVVDVRGEGRKAFINPQVIETSVEEVPYEEGCLSVPGVWHDVIRPQSITIQALDVEGKPFTLKADGMMARVIQHENDHLSGILFIDRLDPEEKEKMVKAYEKRNKVRTRKSR